jgi:hypothetical protein
MHSFTQKMGWPTFWATFPQTHLVTLVDSREEHVLKTSDIGLKKKLIGAQHLLLPSFFCLLNYTFPVFLKKVARAWEITRNLSIFCLFPAGDTNFYMYQMPNGVHTGEQGCPIFLSKMGKNLQNGHKNTKRP